MLRLISKLFANKASNNAAVGQIRQVNLSGNIFSFAMPEDFSRDMPAENLVENLDIEKLEKFNNPAYGNLIRRWWDIKHPGFFGKNLGTVMMDISVQRVPENKRKLVHEKPYNIQDRLDFFLMIDESLHQRYDELVEQTKNAEHKLSYSLPGFATLLGKKLLAGYRDYIYNQQRWTGYSVSAPVNQLIVGRVVPITAQVYLEVVFSYSPDHNIFPREFRGVAYEKMKLIEESFNIDYVKGNVVDDVVGKFWLKTINDQVLESRRDLLLVPLFGSKIYEELAGDDQRMLEVQKALAKLDAEEKKHNGIL